MIRINLLVDKHLKDRIIVQHQIFLGIGAMFVALALCAFWWTTKSNEIDATNEKIVVAKKELADQQKIRKKVKAMEATEKRLNAILVSINYLVAQKAGPAPYLDHLNLVLPGEVWLTNLTDRGGNIGVEGFSFSNNAVAKLMKNMEEAKTFVNIELAEITTAKINKETLKKFKVSSVTAAAHKREQEKIKRQLEEDAKNPKKKGKKRR